MGMSAARPDTTPAEIGGKRLSEAALPARLRLAVATAVLAVVAIGLITVAPAAIGPAPRQQPLLPGLTLEDTRPPVNIVVTSVQDNSIADDAGVRVGDAVVALDGQQVNSLADIGRYIGQHHPVVVDLQLVRGSHPVEVVYAFPQKAKA
jgi:S1-C subfamily serine protease